MSDLAKQFESKLLDEVKFKRVMAEAALDAYSRRRGLITRLFELINLIKKDETYLNNQ